MGDEEVIPDQLYFFAQTEGHRLPSFPVILSKAILNGEDRKYFDQVFIIGDHFSRSQFRLFSRLEKVEPIPVEFGRCRINPETDILSRAITGLFDGFKNQFHCIGVLF